MKTVYFIMGITVSLLLLSSFPGVQSQYSCTDSDGGNDTFVKGTVDGYYPIDNTNTTLSDYCSSSTTLEEYLCFQGGDVYTSTGVYILKRSHSCSNSCSVGQCIPAPSPPPAATPTPTTYPSCPVNVFLDSAVNNTECLCGGNFPPYPRGWCCSSSTASAGSWISVGFSNTCQYASTPTPTYTTCTDSDGGTDFTKKGTCTDSTGTYADYCNGGTSPITDVYCSNGFCKEAYLSGICVDGASVPISPTYTTCTDIDGQNHYVKGTCTDSTGTYTDFCAADAGIGKYIREYYCTTSKGPCVAGGQSGAKCADGALIGDSTQTPYPSSTQTPIPNGTNTYTQTPIASTPTPIPTQAPTTTQTPVFEPTKSPTPFADINYTQTEKKAAISCSTDQDCSWTITNGCPETAGANWACNSLLEPIKTTSAVCPQILSQRPSISCGCIQNKCLAYLDKKPTEVPKKIGNTTVDATTLLSIVIQIEQLKIKFDFLQSATEKLSKYYNLTGKEESSQKWSKASEMLEDSINRLDKLKESIRSKISDLTIEDLRSIKKEIKSVVQTIREIVKLVV